MLNATGYVVAAHKIELASKVVGRVAWVGVEMGDKIEPGVVTQDGALWSPARLEMSDVGLQLFLGTTSVGKDNVDDPRLWGNIEKANGG